MKWRKDPGFCVKPLNELELGSCDKGRKKGQSLCGIKELKSMVETTKGNSSFHTRKTFVSKLSTHKYLQLEMCKQGLKDQLGRVA